MWHSMDVEAVLAKLNSKSDGLEEGEVLRRLDEGGRNELVKEKGTSPFTLFFNQFKNVLIIILLIATLLSLLVGETVDALIIAVIVIFSATLGFVQEYRAERALEALKKMLSATITVLRSGKERELDVREVVPGDILLLEAGDKVPADARILESIFLHCDEASLTGESLPVEKTARPLEDNLPVADRRNMVYTGSVVTNGKARVVVTATGMGTEFGKIAKEVAGVKAEKTPLEKRTEEIGKGLGLFCVLICVLVVGISVGREWMLGTLRPQSTITMLMFGIALAVAAVPEALAAIVTGALAIGMRDMARHNALIRKMPAVETLGCTTVICTDKTGTLTRGEMTVRKIFMEDRYVEVTGAGYAPKGEFKGGEGLEIPLERLLKGVLLCNDASLLGERNGEWAIQGDPTEAALVVAALKGGLKPDRVQEENPKVFEIPFNSERKLMTTVHGEDDGKMAYVKGAPEVVMARCSHLLDKEGGIRPFDAKVKEIFVQANGEMASQALRVLALAIKKVEGEVFDGGKIEHDLVLVGLLGMMDPPRPEALKAVEACKEVHMKPVMITGDHQLTAVAVAREMGIYSEGDRVLTGVELEKMGEEEFDSIVDRVSVYARVSPADKLKIVNAWKRKGEVVAMTGDGVNDAPALKQADIGIAMGISGTEVAKEAADMVLSDDNFATIVTAIERGRWIYDNIKKYLAYLLQCNITEVMVIGGIVLIKGPEFLPLLPAAILYINLATDGLPALALGAAPPDGDIMKRPPRAPKESVFDWEVKSFILRALLIESPFFYFTFFHHLADLETARTHIFFLFVIIEFVVALNCRSLTASICQAPPHKWLLIALGWELVLIVLLIQIPSVRESFGIRLPSFAELRRILLFGLTVFAIIEGTKVLLRKRKRNDGRGGL